MKSNRSKLVEVLERLRCNLRLAEKVWADRLGLTEVGYMKIIQGDDDLPITALCYLVDELHLNPEQVESGAINYAAVYERENGNLRYLDPKYRVAAFSKRLTVLNALNCVEMIRGWKFREMVNRYFHVHEAVWHEGNEPINLVLLTELWDYLRRKGLRQEELYNIGRHTFLTYGSTSVADVLVKAENMTSLYEVFFGGVTTRIEKNCTYQIMKLTSGACVVDSYTNRDVAESLGVTDLGSEDGCSVRAGVMSSMSGFLGVTMPEVVHTRCVHRGDSVCRFEIKLLAGANDDKFLKRPAERPRPRLVCL